MDKGDIIFIYNDFLFDLRANIVEFLFQYNKSCIFLTRNSTFIINAECTEKDCHIINYKQYLEELNLQH